MLTFIAYLVVGCHLLQELGALHISLAQVIDLSGGAIQTTVLRKNSAKAHLIYRVSRYAITFDPSSSSHIFSSLLRPSNPGTAQQHLAH